MATPRWFAPRTSRSAASIDDDRPHRHARNIWTLGVVSQGRVTGAGQLIAGPRRHPAKGPATRR